MGALNDYKNLLTEIIQKQMDILGPEIALRKAGKVTGLKVRDNGEVLEITGDKDQALQALVDEYIALSGEIVKNILKPVLAKYPEVKLNLK